MKTTFNIIIFLCLFGAIYAQENNAVKNKKSSELGLNVTNVLSNVLSLDKNQVDDPFSLVLKIPTKNNYLRIFTDVGWDRSSSDVDFNGASKISSNQNFGIKLGLEHRLLPIKKFQMFYGLDVLANYKRNTIEETDVLDFTQSYLKEKTSTVGLVSFIGFMYRISSNLIISTEYNIGFVFGKNNVFLDLSGTDSDLNSSDPFFSLKQQLPSNLFLSFKF